MLSGFGWVRVVHVRGVHPHEEGRLGLMGPSDEVLGGQGEFIVDRFHPLPGQRPGVFYRLPPYAAVPRIRRIVIVIAGVGVDDTARARPPVELGEVLLRRPVRRLRLFLGVEVVEVAEELVEPVHRRQELVPVAEVILAELAGGIAEWFEQLRDRRVLRLQPDIRAWHADLAQPGAKDALARDERRSAGPAALFAVGVREPHALIGDSVDVRGAIPPSARRCRR